MVILALDTTTRTGSCALTRDGVVLREHASDPQRSHAEHLPGDLIDLLAAEQVGLDQVDAFAVATGPGSFTGLRVGIATMQGLAFATGKPLAGVSALDALAHVEQDSWSRLADRTRLTPGVLVATWIDAWRGEVYAALYEDGREIQAPSVEHPAAIVARMRGDDRLSRTIFIGDGAATFAGFIREHGGAVADPASPLIAGTIARMAYDQARAAPLPRPDAIRPLYVRRTDAELARDARSAR
jgi:tRNA threonylcarbamoyladenosine biosynthesis protein TsaB